MAKNFIKSTNGYMEIESEMPKAIMDKLDAKDIWKGGGEWLLGASFIKNMDDFIITTNNGWYYKVGAVYMVWHVVTSNGTFTPAGTREIVAQAIWSTAALKRTLKSLMKTGEIVRDPDYQT